MHTCRICHFETPLDDVAVHGPAGQCVCLHCYTRETGTAQPMPRALRNVLLATLAALDVAQP